MLTDLRKKNTSPQPNSPNLSYVDTNKITTICELRRKARLRNRQKSTDYQEWQARRVSERWQFCKVMHEMCEKLATVFNIDNALTTEAIYSLFDSHNWYSEGHFHSEQTPLSIRFIKPLSFLGQLELENITPCYNGLLPGEYDINRDRPTFRPHPELIVMGSLAA